MTTFIRLDMAGHWRGTEHISSMNGMAGEWCDDFEIGISCYELEEESMSLLFDYWMNYAGLNSDDIERNGTQVTIFEGDRLEGEGFNGEEMAECTRTIAQFSAKELFEKWMEMIARFDEAWMEDETDADDATQYVEEHASEVFEFIKKQMKEAIAQ